MATVLKTWRPDGRLIITPLGEGGVFIEVLGRNQGDGSTTIVYPGLVGLTLRVFQVYAGSFTWNTGVDGSGNPFITLNALPDTYNGGPLTLIVFAV